MSANSTIEWTDATWNPVTGCDRVSPGCDNCYAERIATRFGRPFLGAVECHPERLELPLRWRKPRRVFVNSVSDLFHPDIPDEFIGDVFAVMARASTHTFQILTKRPQRMASWIRGFAEWHRTMKVGDDRFPWPLPNVWLGVSVENQRYADLRIPHLLETPAAVRFISAEPLLGPVTLAQSNVDYLQGWETVPEHSPECNGGAMCANLCPIPMQVQTRRLDWCIVGGESGHGARPMEAEWVRTLRDECVAASVPFFFKQWGGRTPKANGRELDGRVWDEYPA